MRASEFIIENFGKYPEIEFICVNKDVPGSTDPKDQEALFQSLKKVPGIVVYRQDFDEDEDDFSGGKSLAVIIVKGGNTTAKRVKALAAQHNVKIDLTAQKDDRFIDRLYNGSEPAVTDWFDNSIDKDIHETISTGLGGGSAGGNGGQMVGGPTTYEQEYNMFKRKGPRRITAMTNEALDSSYPYEGKAISGRYTFKTEDGVSYKVYFQGKDLVEVAFSAILPGEEENFRPDKTTLTGTGNSAKVFGTVVKIVKEFLEEQEPKALYFTGEGSEPSRIRLYDRMISQVDKELPDYYAEKTIDLGSGKAYMLRRKEEVTEDL